MTAQQMIQDQRFLFRDFPTEEISISGVDYRCLSLQVEDRNQWQDGGFLETPDAAVLIERSTAPDPLPAPGAPVIFRDEEWEIVAVHQDHPQAPLELSLRRAAK